LGFRHSRLYFPPMTQSIYTGQRKSLAKIGGALGIAGACIGIGIFIVACAGFGAAFYLSLIPLILGIPGLILSIIGGFQKPTGVEDTHVVAALILNMAVIFGALLEMAVWLRWPLFGK
jgi:hypothetical protein